MWHLLILLDLILYVESRKKSAGEDMPGGMAVGVAAGAGPSKKRKMSSVTGEEVR